MGSISSLAIAASSLGAPVRLCKAAPSVDRMTPICTTAGSGHATVAVNSLFQVNQRAQLLMKVIVKEQRHQLLQITMHHYSYLTSKHIVLELITTDSLQWLNIRFDFQNLVQEITQQKVDLPWISSLCTHNFNEFVRLFSWAIRQLK